MNKYLEEAIKMANDTVEMCDIPFEETFPYETFKIEKDDQGKEYKVHIIIEMVK